MFKNVSKLSLSEFTVYFQNASAKINDQPKILLKETILYAKYLKYSKGITFQINGTYTHVYVIIQDGSVCFFVIRIRGHIFEEFVNMTPLIRLTNFPLRQRQLLENHIEFKIILD